MESLSDELLLQIFCYLRKFDFVVYSFNNLNQRFQNIIQSFLYEIDLTDSGCPSFRHWHFFIKHILRTQMQAVQSLKLQGAQ